MMEKKDKTAFVLAAAQSGGGKTTMAMALMAGFDGIVQPYKVGPDYIDPMYHRAATGRHSRNLDSYMLDEETVSYLFHRQMDAADVGIVEGVMGLYDGVSDQSSVGSTAHIARILDLPIVLIFDPQGMSLTMAALIRGLRDFSPENRFAGVIFNQIKSEGMYLYAKHIVETVCDLPVFGYLPKLEGAGLDSRHLGLICSGEVENLSEKIRLLGAAAQKTIDFDAIRKAAPYRHKEARPPLLPEPLAKPVRIGLAFDDAFNFFYQDSFDLFTMLGADLVFLSPIEDDALPPLDGLILGGGYPEIYGAALAANRSFKTSLRKALEDGLPCFAECGGFIYLGKSLQYQGESHEMAGFFPYNFVMTDRLQRFGYLEAAIEEDNFLGTPGALIRGHEFHHTTMAKEDGSASCYRIQRPGRNETRCDGYRLKNTIAAYPHFHFWSNPGIAKKFLEIAQAYRDGRYGI